MITKIKPTNIGNRGFSLIELMVVIVILGILAMYIAPKLMGRTDDARHMPLGRTNGEGHSAVIEDGREPTDIEKEMVASAENQIFYSAAAKIIGGNFKALKAVIRGRFTN